MATSTRTTRELGSLLRSARKASGKKVDEVATHVDQAPSSVSRYELGELKTSWPMIKTILEFVGVSAGDPVMEDAWGLYQAAKNEPKPVSLPKGASAAFRRLVHETGDATGLRELATTLIPGMMQDERYMMALAQALGDPTRRAIAVRKQRQVRLDHQCRKPLWYHAVLDEICLTRVVGEPSVMLAQLEHLDRLAQQPNVTLQVVPKEAGDYGAATGGLTLVDYEPGVPSWVYFEYQAGASVVDNPDDVQRFAKVFDNAAGLSRETGELQWKGPALSPDETASFIRQQIGVLTSDA
ncbi:MULTISPECIES: helix-turn-helix domain-containing protein [Amycolatopsis]|uniref:Helix-turn-helix transcriptional regulator n=1 Tax=Amycolatopsis albidoflavus TaxID=102226 RepID=A0ABW5HTH8_9PSEU